jgi:hypothetical protein
MAPVNERSRKSRFFSGPNRPQERIISREVKLSSALSIEDRFGMALNPHRLGQPQSGHPRELLQTSRIPGEGDTTMSHERQKRARRTAKGIANVRHH